MPGRAGPLGVRRIRIGIRIATSPSCTPAAPNAVPGTVLGSEARAAPPPRGRRFRPAHGEGRPAAARAPALAVAFIVVQHAALGVYFGMIFAPN
ncbi:hypothetical protein ACWELO_36320, partial [Streptomyces sp. NPDC004596]